MSRRWRWFGYRIDLHVMTRPEWGVKVESHGYRRYRHVRIWLGRSFVALYIGDPA